VWPGVDRGAIENGGRLYALHGRAIHPIMIVGKAPASSLVRRRQEMQWVPEVL
jgi:hypothetical protein